MDCDFTKFLLAQDYAYSKALAQIKAGRKTGHWMWYIFPQIEGLGFSENSQLYAINDLEEAALYLQHEILGERLREIANELLLLTETNIKLVFDSPDDKKLKSCLTLFAQVEETSENVFVKLIDKYFDGNYDGKTIKILNKKDFQKMNIKANKVIDCLLGVAVGDALGVPFEFKRTDEMVENPATDMTEYGTHQQPMGTWSDDSALTFCLAESLTTTYDLVDMAKKFVDWKNNNYWTANGDVFDIGITTYHALSKLEEILSDNDFERLETLKNNASEFDNGNGSLMRILPLLFHIKSRNSNEQFEIIWEASALTHKHSRAAMSCFIYLKLAEYLLLGEEKEMAYSKMRDDVVQLWDSINFDKVEQQHFKRIITHHILETQREDLKSGGYVIESLEASLWCFMNESDYKTTVLSVINLGHDTDTTGAITGGLAGLYYGVSTIPTNWIKVIKRLDAIVDLGNRLNNKLI